MKIQHLLIALTLPAVLALSGCETTPTTEAAPEAAIVTPVATPVAEIAPVATPTAPVNHEHCAKHKAETAAHDCKTHCAKHKGKKIKRASNIAKPLLPVMIAPNIAQNTQA